MKLKALLGFYNNKNQYITRCRVTDGENTFELEYDQLVPLVVQGKIEGLGYTETFSSRKRVTRIISTGVEVVWGIDKMKSLRYMLTENVLNEFDEAKNFPITTLDIGSQSDRKLWWKCSNGHSWQALPGHRKRGDGCPFCNSRTSVPIKENSLQYWCEEHREFLFLIEEYNNGNNSVPISNIYKSSNNKVNWKCSKCGEVFSMTPNWRTAGFINTCPHCSKEIKSSRCEYYVLEWIKKAFPYYKVEHQKSFDDIGNKTFDMYIPDIQLLIEYNGSYWHKENKNDKIKAKYAIDNGYKLLVIEERDNASSSYIADNVIVYNRDKRYKNITELFNLVSLYISKIAKTDVVWATENDAKIIIEKGQSKMTLDKGENSLENKFPNFMKYWSKQNKISPKHISYGSEQVCIWECPNGHIIQKSANAVTNRGYLYCAQCNTRYS